VDVCGVHTHFWVNTRLVRWERDVLRHICQGDVCYCVSLSVNLELEVSRNPNLTSLGKVKGAFSSHLLGGMTCVCRVHRLSSFIGSCQ
jgi:hypothetical protein